jgi:serine/threonine-protein kinase
MGKTTSVQVGMSIDRYVVERELGRGATAVVYLARDREAGRMVALKVMRDELVGTISTERFFREIRRTSELSHPHIVPLLASGEFEGKPFCVLPFMDGGTLRQRLEREKQFPIAEAVDIATQVAHALAFAHQHNLIHRDVKPENILFTAGQATLADFGIARALERSSTESTTSTGVVRGTPAYMSPEQAVGETNLDGRTDVYSLGCVLYEMLAGMQAFVGPTPQAVLAQRISHPPRPIRVYRPTVPLALEAVLDKALATSAADRYRTAEEFSNALESVDLRETRDSPARPLAAADRRGRRVGVWMVGAALLVIVTASVIAWPGRNANSQEDVVPEGDPRRIAVLYLENQTPTTLSSHLADGITEDLIDLLVDARPLHVVTANAVRQFRGTTAPPDSVARRLKVGTIVSGSIARLGDSISLTIRLTDGSSARQIDSHTISSPVGNLLALQRELADQVSIFLRRRVGSIVRLREYRAGTKSAPAWELVQLARAVTREGLAQGRLRGDAKFAADNYRRADSLYARAGTIDPSWILPAIYRGKLALLQSAQSVVPPDPADSLGYAAASPPMRRRMWVVRALQYADSALVRDKRSPEALALRASARLELLTVDATTPDSVGQLAAADGRAAVALRPNFPEAWYTLAQLALRAGRFAEAASAAQFAYDVDAYFQVSAVTSTGFLAALRAEHYDDARRWCERGLALNAGDPRFAECRLTLLGWSATSRSGIEDAWRELQRIERSDTLGMLRITASYRRLMIAAVAARSGLEDSARSILARANNPRQNDPNTVDYPIEESYVLLLTGDRDGAIARLSKIAPITAQTRASLANHPWFKTLHDDPRFRALISSR